MESKDINIRDPYVLMENSVYYLYGTRAQEFGKGTGGFDVYTSKDLQHWSEPATCFCSDAYGLNREVNWAPEVHCYQGKYYMSATFTQENGLRGTYILRADNPMGPFVPHSHGAVTPTEWECLDGTLYVENGKPYLVFCHEHTQILDGTICYVPLNTDLTATDGDVKVLFCASSPYYADKPEEGKHFITDGPFLYRTKTGVLLMLWSTFIQGKYAECLVRFQNGITGGFEHLAPLSAEDGGHGMIFKAGESLFLTLHSPNQTGAERPQFLPLIDKGDYIEIL